MAFAALTALPAAAAERPKANPSTQPAVKLPRIPDNVVLERDVPFGQVGETPLLLDIVRPKADSPQPRPVILFIHGGGWAGGDKASAIGALLPFASSGQYFCASANYRLTGQASWPAQIQDCKAAVRWLKINARKYNIDPQKIGVWGHSAGGHLVSMLGLTGNRPELEGHSGALGASSQVACVVDFSGPSDMIAFVTYFAEKKKTKAPPPGLDKFFGEPIEQWKEVARQASPLTYVSRDAAPFLIVHGTADPLVPLAQAEDLAAALKKAGADVTLVKIVDGGHGIGGPALLDRVRKFFDKHLRGQNVEVSDAPIQAPPPQGKK